MSEYVKKDNDSRKIFTLLIMIFTLMICTTGATYAYLAITSPTNSAMTGTAATANVILTNNTTNNTTDNNTTNNTMGEGTTNNPVQDLTPSTPNTNSANNTSTYEESNIPHAGVEDTILMGTAFVVFAVIGIYTFMKLSEYSNI